VHGRRGREVKERAGGQVRRGEKAAGLVVLWKYDEERKEQDPATGEERRVVALRERPIVRYHRVFHLGQCDGIEPEDLAAPAPMAPCEEVIRRNAPRVRAGEPAYYPARNVITMPAPARFESMAAYYAAFFHELTHWTGAAHRLDREGITAEIGAAFLCAITGTDTPPVAENQAAYVAGWLRHIREGTAADVVRAASDAQKAADWITGGPAPASSLGTLAYGPGVLPVGRCRAGPGDEGGFADVTRRGCSPIP